MSILIFIITFQYTDFTNLLVREIQPHPGKQIQEQSEVCTAVYTTKI